MKAEINHNKLIRNSFFCGVILQYFTSLGILAEMPMLAILVGIILPGAIYSFLMLSFNIGDFKQGFFVLIGGALHILSAFVCGNLNMSLPFLIAASLSCPIYFILYYILVNNNYSFIKGFLMSLLAGLISAVIPCIVLESKSIGRSLSIVLLFSVFPLWQTLFAVALKLSAKPNTQNIIPPTSVTTA